MDQLTELLEPVIDFVLGNIGLVVFAIFLLSGLIGRGDKKKEQGESAPAPERRARPEGDVDDRPLAERLAEAFGVEIPEDQRSPQPQQSTQSRPQPQEQRYGSEGRRSTVRRNVQDEYPQLFGGPGVFDQDAQDEEAPRWGFDETEWGTTFDRNDDQWGSEHKWRSDDQWGNSFPDRKSSEPRIDFPN